nr:hypothetical protein [Tanacetum cinerariifolium]
MDFVSSPSTNSTNEVHTAYGVSTASTQPSTASTQPEFEGYGPKTSKSVCEDISDEAKESPDVPLVKKLVSYDKLEKKIVVPTIATANCNYHQRERVVSRNDYTMVNYNNSTRKTHPNAHRNMAPTAVLMKTGLRPLNNVRPVNTAHPKTTTYCARPMSRFFKSAQLTVKRPYQQRTSLTNKSFSQTVNTTRPRPVNAARPKPVNTVRPRPVNTARPRLVNIARHNLAVVNAVRTSRNLMDDMLPLGEELKEEELLVKELLKLNSVLFTDTGCFVLSLDFKLIDES